MIQTTKVVKTFDGFRALDNLNLNVPTGAIYGLVGPNGAGKSTILRHLTGVMQQDSGEVHIEGMPVFENNALKQRIASIPDDIFYFPQATIHDMMKFYSGVYPKFDRTLYVRLKEAFELNERMQMRRLSKGMLKQAAFWLALCTHPDYLLLDEPVDGLDPVMRRQIWSLILENAEQHGTTVLVSSHNLRELEDVCDHVGIMDHGAMLLERSLAELQDNIVKVQLASESPLPVELQVLHETAIGRVRTLIIRGTQDEITKHLNKIAPMFVDIIPLSLEEIFIYELGGVDYAVKNIVL